MFDNRVAGEALVIQCNLSAIGLILRGIDAGKSNLEGTRDKLINSSKQSQNSGWRKQFRSVDAFVRPELEELTLCGSLAEHVDVT